MVLGLDEVDLFLDLMTWWRGVIRNASLILAGAA